MAVFHLPEKGDRGLTFPMGDTGVVADDDEKVMEHGMQTVHGTGRGPEVRMRFSASCNARSTTSLVI
jgi:hypothetical protein